MRIKMLRAHSGSCDGQEFPPAGGEIELPDLVAVDLLNIGAAEAIAVPAEQATAPKSKKS